MNFLSTPADIAIGGGAAGVGKTFAELLEPLRHINNPRFGAVFFRRTMPQITNEGGLWDESKHLYHQLGAVANNSEHYWTFKSGASVSFSHLQYEDTCLEHQGAQYPLIIFDELTHFTETQFLYMLSRNRSTCGIKSYMRATCNPDPDSWVARWIEWYIDQETGFPIPERAGVIRYFAKIGDNIIWGNSKQEVVKNIPQTILELPEFKDRDASDLVKSFTFIPGSISDNKELHSKDPGYLGNLLAQDENTRLRLLQGNWKVRTDGSNLFEYLAIDGMFESESRLVSSRERYITCDAARFGRDFCVIMVWKGWSMVYIAIYTKSDVNTIVNAIERLRLNFKVPRQFVLVDQDGVGGGTVKEGKYQGFHGGGQPLKDSAIKEKENYFNLKTQCAYRLAEENVNAGEIELLINSQSCEVDGVLGDKLMWKGKLTRVVDLIKADFKAIKKADKDKEGKKKINHKDEQKIVLGRSPDFFDTINMRKWFDLKPKRKGITVY